MRNLSVLSAALFVVNAAMCDVVELPSISIAGTTVDTTVTYDSARAVYRYAYVIHAPVTNKAPIVSFKVDISGGRMNRSQLDSDLQNNVERDEATTPPLQPLTTIPVGILVPNPSRYYGGVGKPAWVFFSSIKGAGDIAPGQDVGGFVVESKFPPGKRNAFLNPSEATWTVISMSAPKGTEF